MQRPLDRHVTTIPSSWSPAPPHSPSSSSDSRGPFTWGSCSESRPAVAAPSARRVDDIVVRVVLGSGALDRITPYPPAPAAGHPRRGAGGTHGDRGRHGGAARCRTRSPPSPA